MLKCGILWCPTYGITIIEWDSGWTPRVQYVLQPKQIPYKQHSYTCFVRVQI